MRSTNRSIALAAVAFSAAATLAQNTGVRLTDGDATFDYAFGGTLPAVSNGPAGNVSTNFQLNGLPGTGPNWMPNLNWFYRYQGDTRERQLSGTSAQITQIPTGSNEIEYQFSTIYTGGAANTPVPNASAHMHFRVLDTGVDRARLTTQVCFENTGSTTFTVDTFCVANIDIMATALNDVYSPLIVTPLSRQWIASDSPGMASMLGAGALGAGVGDFSTIMGQMLDTGPDNFTPDVSPAGFAGTSDAYAVMQFQCIVPPQSIVCIPLDFDIEIVPEPTSAVLLIACLTTAIRRKGRRS